MGERRKGALRVKFDGELKLEFHGAKISSDAGTKWGTRRYINMDHFKEIMEDSAA